VNPDIGSADDLAWSLLAPDAAPSDLPAGFKVTVSQDVSQPVAVRPDGIVASAELVHQLFGFNLARDRAGQRLQPSPVTFPHTLLKTGAATR